MRMRYREGDVLFREGDPADFVARILEGRVAVEKDWGGTAERLGEIGPGDVAGEMGVIERKPRSATIRALTETVVEAIPADQFLAQIATDSEAAAALLHRLSEKVRALSDEVVRLRHAAEVPPADEAPAPPDPVPESKPDPAPPPADMAERQIRTYQRSATASTRITLRYKGLPDGRTVRIDALPFRVTRTPHWADPPSVGRAILRVPDGLPPRLSAPHFAIDRDERLGLVVRDLGSELGTTVNGQYLGGIFAKDTQILHLGRNVVVAGGTSSPFVFLIDVSG